MLVIIRDSRFEIPAAPVTIIMESASLDQLVRLQEDRVYTRIQSGVQKYLALSLQSNHKLKPFQIKHANIKLRKMYTTLAQMFATTMRRTATHLIGANDRRTPHPPQPPRQPTPLTDSVVVEYDEDRDVHVFTFIQGSASMVVHSKCFYKQRHGQRTADTSMHPHPCPKTKYVAKSKQHTTSKTPTHKSYASYAVDVDDLTCTCPDFVYRNKKARGKTCKHIRQVLRWDKATPR